ncbi:MAG: hypothetical protein Hyperionvirus14_7 [Hyperionvirus sp.]|uniref:Uncharacterized protein n=1 Tax=Hyperionvirus sp. TaxID=2487770 RepID=A0A3G5A9H7_9VIRU|nr:MAG: hypothetical protein Hyperionvirus14_7 [Hyperionvirus sp.]
MADSKIYTAGPCRFKDCTIGCQRFKCNAQNSEYCGLCHHDYGFHEALGGNYTFVPLAHEHEHNHYPQYDDGYDYELPPPPKQTAAATGLAPHHSYQGLSGLMQAQNLSQAQQALQAHHIAQAQQALNKQNQQQPVNCPSCKDTKKIECAQCNHTGIRVIPCEVCLKSGYKKCKSCRGHGKFSDKCNVDCMTNYKEEAMTKELSKDMYSDDSSRYWDAKNPTKQLVTFSRCFNCKGTLKPCKICAGLGTVRCDYCDGEKFMTYNCGCNNDFTVPCPQCTKPKPPKLATKN